MAVEFRSNGVSPGAQTTTCVIVKPVGLSEGDLMIAHVFARGECAMATPASGFSIIREDHNANVTKSWLYYKIADSDDVAAASFTFTFTDSEYNLGAIAAFTGIDASNPINADNGASTGQTTTPTAPTITPSVADCMICLFCAGSALSTYSAYAIATANPGSWTEAYDFSETIVAVTESLAMGYALRPETSATGDGTATSTLSQYWVAQLIAIAPAGEVLPSGQSAPLFAALEMGIL